MTSAAESTRREDLIAGLKAGDRRALARAITLIESTRPADREDADAVLEAVLPQTGRSVRLGLSGPPGAGKSSFIEAFGNWLIDGGHRVAVLAVDPSSSLSGGAILGDKTRMQALSRRADAFVRPSPAGGIAGGVARRTREAILLVEAAGFDMVLVETVGVGQSETAVNDMVDMFLLLTPPAAGDELQGIKRGAMELADAVLVTKADGDLAPAASRAAAQYRMALQLMRPKHAGWTPPVIETSAIEKKGLEDVSRAIGDFRDVLGAAEISDNRRGQRRAWLWAEIEAGLIAAFTADPEIAKIWKATEADVLAETRTPPAAARDLLALFTAATGRPRRRG